MYKRFTIERQIVKIVIFPNWDDQFYLKVYLFFPAFCLHTWGISCVVLSTAFPLTASEILNISCSFHTGLCKLFLALSAEDGGRVSLCSTGFLNAEMIDGYHHGWTWGLVLLDQMTLLPQLLQQLCGAQSYFYRLRLPYTHSAQFCYKSTSCLGHSRLQEKLQRLHVWQSPRRPRAGWPHHTAGWQCCFSPLSLPQWKAHPNRHQSSGSSLRWKTDSQDSGSPSSGRSGKVWFG